MSATPKATSTIGIIKLMLGGRLSGGSDWVLPDNALRLPFETFRRFRLVTA